jgi:hypothetical protein
MECFFFFSFEINTSFLCGQLILITESLPSLLARQKEQLARMTLLARQKEQLARMTYIDSIFQQGTSLYLLVHMC